MVLTVTMNPIIAENIMLLMNGLGLGSQCKVMILTVVVWMRDEPATYYTENPICRHSLYLL
jgi:hypothetical protein